MDNLEEYIMEHRTELDRYKPSSALRKRIRRELKPDRSSYFRILAAAAMIVIILGSALLLLKPGLRSALLLRARKTAGTDYQLKETEIYYNNLANSLYTQATPLLVKNPEIQKELTIDLSHIDSICGEIKKDLKDNVSNSDVVEALIRNYRTKIEILENMLNVLKENEGKNEKKKGHEL